MAKNNSTPRHCEPKGRALRGSEAICKRLRLVFHSRQFPGWPFIVGGLLQYSFAQSQLIDASYDVCNFKVIPWMLRNDGCENKDCFIALPRYLIKEINSFIVLKTKQ